MKRKDVYSMLGTLKMRSLKYKRRMMIFIVFLLLFLCWKQIFAHEKQAIQFGKFITQSDDAWGKLPFKPELPNESFYAKILTLELPAKTAVFYYDKNWEAILLAYEQGQKRLLWKIHDPYPSSGQMPYPVLAAVLLNANQEFDLLFCHSNDRGIGKSAEHWDQNMYLFIDSQKTTEKPIPLSVVDISLCDSDQADCRGVWERQDALVLIVPASEDTPGTIYVWSQRYRSEDQPPGATERMYTYQIVEYQVKEDQLVNVETTEGSRLQTSELLRSIIWTRREQGNEPLLLNFAYPPYLFDENTWLNFFTYRE